MADRALDALSKWRDDLASRLPEADKLAHRIGKQQGGVGAPLSETAGHPHVASLTCCSQALRSSTPALAT